MREMKSRLGRSARMKVSMLAENIKGGKRDEGNI